jgi:hypothetical protein
MKGHVNFCGVIREMKFCKNQSVGLSSLSEYSSDSSFDPSSDSGDGFFDITT